MKTYFVRLEVYNQWANRRVLNALNSFPVSEECWKLFSHLVLAEWVWRSRLEGHSPQISVFTVLDPESLEQKLEENARGWKDSFENLDMVRSLSYQNLQGEPFTSIVTDILAHVFNHSTYHRAQIAQRLRQEGFQPPSTDYISFSRLEVR